MQKPRIALFGPIAPFRGGIAQYTTSLAQALGDHAEVVSFKRQYPKFLYPGKTDKEANAAPLPGAQYTLDIYNPLTWRRAADAVQADLVVLDWWTLIWQPGFAYIAWRLRKRGIKTAFLCHNLRNHKTGGFMGTVDTIMGGIALWSLKQADAFIVQSSEQQKLLAEIAPGKPSLLQMHPIYTRFPVAQNPLPKRGKLELLFFGFIREYKGLDIFLDALKQLNDHDIFVTVVGETWDEKVKQQLQHVDIPNVEVRLEYVDDAEAANYFARADAVVLPYRSATGSGVVAVAYNYGKPVIASAVGGLKDAVVEGATGLLVEPENPQALATVLQSLTRERLAAMQPAIEAFCKEHSWENEAKAIIHFATELNA